MDLEQTFKSKGQETYCMFLRVKKSALQSEISEIEKKISPLRSKQFNCNYTCDYTETEKQLLNSTNLKITELYKELDKYNLKIKDNNCQSYYEKVKSCKFTDEQIKNKKDLISELAKGVVAGRSNPSDLQQLNKELLGQENIFAENDCRNLIEYERLAESGMILTEQSVKSEQNFLKGSNTEQYIYIGAGALVLLVGVYVILKK